MSGELPAEVRAIIDAALAWDDQGGRANTWEMSWNQTLHDAVDAYRKATAPPEPFEAYAGVHRNRTIGGSLHIAPDILVNHYGEVWRCAVTPIERVR